MKNVDPTAVISPLADIETSSRGSRLIVKEGAYIDSFVKVKFAGGAGDVFVGPNCYINSGTVIYSGNGVSLVSNVLVAANCTFAATNHAFSNRSVLVRNQGFMPSRGGIIVEDDVWIGANCVLLDGTHVQRGAVLSAGSVVRGKVPAFAIMSGAIAQKIGERGQ